MYKFIFLFLSFLLLQTPVTRCETLKTSLQRLNKPATTVDYTSNCSNCPKVIELLKTTNLRSLANHAEINLSVLSLNDASNLFQELATNPEIPFRYLKDGCYARADKMVRLMEKKGIISGKAWVSGNIFVDKFDGPPLNWEYHVAPVIMVQEETGPAPYVIDPSLAHGPIPFQQWKSKMLENPDSVINDEYYTNRFVFRTQERDKKVDHYRKKDIKIADEVNRELLELQKEDNL
jgi:hypothetical protein